MGSCFGIRAAHLAGMAALIAAIVAPHSGTSQERLFQLLSPKETGVHFSNNIDETEALNVLSYEYFYNGGGVAIGDINNDGLEDIFFTSNMGPNKLYLNLGNMKFKDISKEAGIEGRPGGWKTGVTMADVNGDGLLDIYVCYSGNGTPESRRNQLFINQGNGTFKDEAKEYGLDDPGYGTQAVFADFNNDGYLDMILLNHNVKKIDNMELEKYRNLTDEYAGDKLFMNDGHGHFVDVSKKAGIHQNPLTFGLGVAVADVNQDGYEDIYVTNDYNEPDYLYINNGDGTFTEESQAYFRHLSHFSMGVDIADYNNDGKPDFITLDMIPQDNHRQKLLQLDENYESFQLMINQGLYQQFMRNMLQLNNGDGTFSEIGQLAGVSNTDWSWCPLFADFDNDGYKDLFISNGYLRDYTNKDFLRYWGDYKIKKAVDNEPVKLMDLVNAMPSTAIPSYIFRNNHDLTFANMQKAWGLDQVKVSSGAAYADLDNDGDEELVVNNLNQPAFIYKNLSRELHHTSYLELLLKGKGMNTFAIGAKIYLYCSEALRGDSSQNAAGPGRTAQNPDPRGLQYSEVNPSRGYLSCSSLVQHFGLAHATTVDSVRIIWPDQATQVLRNVPANQKLVIHEGNDTQPLPPPLPKPKPMFTRDSTHLEYTHHEFDDNDFKRQPLMLFMYSKVGPVMAQGDVNGDGREDLFISGGKDEPGHIYLQGADGKFTSVPGEEIGHEDSSTISAAAIFDANGDGIPDLYVAKGGYSLWEPGGSQLQDVLYLGDGKGHFAPAPGYLPDLTASSKSCVRPCDYDGDGDIDVFVGGRVVPGQYPTTPRSYLLTNDGKGHFTITDGPFSKAGMVTDAQWVDLNGDGRKDLVVCGEFMPIMVFLNKPGGFVDSTAEFFDKPERGLWNVLKVADVDGDGKPDLIVGNLGTNTQMHTLTPERPAELYYADFDANGSIDPFLNFYVEGKSYPFVSRDELDDEIYSMRQKFTSYKDYADATMSDIFSPADLGKATKLTATEDRSVVFLNRGGKFVKSVLPLPAQFSMVTRIVIGDFNKDGHPDLILLGNHSDNRLKFGSIDANYGCLLLGDGKGNFSYVPQPESGLSVIGDVKSTQEVTIDGKKYLVIGISNHPALVYQEP